MPFYIPYSEDYLAHHGILGMKWGVRRWQNKDGSLTDAGRKHYNKEIRKAEDRRAKEYRDFHKSRGVSKKGFSRNVVDTDTKIFEKELRNSEEYKNYRKAANDLEEYEITKWDGTFSPGNKHSRLERKVISARETYNKKVHDVYRKHAEEILSARLQDLKLPDNDLYRNVLASHQKEKLRACNIPEDYYLEIFMH